MLILLLSRELNLATAIIYILSALAVIFLTSPIHEFAHGFIADRLGDPTARYQGRLTLNPFAHIDYMGALGILLVGFGGARPVPVNPYNFRNPKRDMAFVAIAGPLSNIVAAFVCMVLANLVLVTTRTLAFYYVFSFFYFIAQINVRLAVFNLIPVPPLDGSRILAQFLPNRIYYKLMQYERYIYFILIILVFSGSLSGPISNVSNALMRGISDLASLPFKVLR